MAAQHEDAPPRSINDFTLLEFLGEGSTAHVYLAEPRENVDVRYGNENEDERDDRVAIKVIDKLLVRHAQLENKIQQEMVLHAQLQHPNVLRVLEVFEDARNYYMVLEYCEQRSVAAMVKALPDRKLDERTAKRFFYEMVSGVAYLHANGVLHRDLKLANLLLTRDSHVKISDFGLATRSSDDHMTVCGTPNFIAPEILANEAAYSVAVDMWSLGCILYCLLIGKAPFEGRKVSETLANVANANSDDLVFATGFSASASDLIKRLLTPDPSRRPSAVQALSHPWLREYAKSASAPASRVSGPRQEHELQPTFPSSLRNLKVSTKPKATTMMTRRGERSDRGEAIRTKHTRTKTKTKRQTDLGQMNKLAGSRLPTEAFAIYHTSASQRSDLDSSSKEESGGSESDVEFELSQLSSISDIDDSDFNDSDGDSTEEHHDDINDEISHDEVPTADVAQATHPSRVIEEANGSNSSAMASNLPIPPSPPVSTTGSYVSVILRMEIQDLSVLDIGHDSIETVKWMCVEAGPVGVSPSFMLHVSNGVEIEYTPSRGLIVGKLADATPVRYEFGRSLKGNEPHLKQVAVADDDRLRNGPVPHMAVSNSRLRTLVRFCHGLALRAMQLRKSALQLATNQLPMVHYDTLPESILATLRAPTSLDAVLLCQQLTVARDDNVHMDDQGCNDNTTVSVEIAGVGRGYLDGAGNLRIAFLDDSQLALDAHGSELQFKFSADSSTTDVFQLAPTRRSTSTLATSFLPSAVKKRLESVPAFIRQLRGA
ncbi:Plk protein kinase, partial [Globisporangium splendens]